MGLEGIIYLVNKITHLVNDNRNYLLCFNKPNNKCEIEYNHKIHHKDYYFYGPEHIDNVIACLA